MAKDMVTFILSLTSAFCICFLINCCKMVHSAEVTPHVNSGCQISENSNLICSGDFNISEILLAQRQNDDKPAKRWKNIRFGNLEIRNWNEAKIDEKTLPLHDYTFETILIENSPNLNEIEPDYRAGLKERLTDFRAINTSLPNYLNEDGVGGKNPFDDFKNLRELYVGRQSSCPEDKNLLFPCECSSGRLKHWVPSGLYRTIRDSFSIGTTTQITCQNDSLSGAQLQEIFQRISSSNHFPKHFDVLFLTGKSVDIFPSDIFRNVSITTIWMRQMDNLKSIHPNAFGYARKSIQILDMVNANFMSANDTKVDDIFKAFRSLTNIRFLRLDRIGIPYVPPFAFVPGNGQLLKNLRYLTISFDRLGHSTGLKSIGSYAFSGAPNLIGLGLQRNFIEKFDSYAFAFNQTSEIPLTIDIGGNQFNDIDGLAPNAFSGSNRPAHIKIAIVISAPDPSYDPTFNFMPENVFRPFLEENPENSFTIDFFNVDIWCDCKSAWMFDPNGFLKQRVQNGIRVMRIGDNGVMFHFETFQCKPESSFECLPNCLIFPLSGLIECGGNEVFDVPKKFEQLEVSIGKNDTKNFFKLKFSSKAIRELEKNSFGNFEFKEVFFTDSRNLTSIHPDAFGATIKTLKKFSAANTSFTSYPNLALFPELTQVQLDDQIPYEIDSNTFDFIKIGEEINISNKTTKELTISMNNGTVDPSTFTKLDNLTNIVLRFGENKKCDTNRSLLECDPSPIILEEKIFRPFLEANPKNKIQTKCYLGCSCELKWMYDDWEKIWLQIDIWFMNGYPNFGKKFYCVPPGVDVKTNDTTTHFYVLHEKFNYGDYFAENC